jgi:fatty acid desaturase
MARRKPRKGAGPPPAVSPRRAAQAEVGAKAAPKRASGEPLPVSARGVFVRAGIVAAFFYPYLIFVAGESPLTAFAIAAIAFGLMLPLGLFLDRVRYRRQMRRYEEKRAKSARR